MQAAQVACQFRNGRRSSALAAFLRIYLFPRRRILFLPRFPGRYQLAYRACALLGYRIVSDPRERHDLAIYFHGRTIARSAEAEGLPHNRLVLNRDAIDISKRKVEDVFAEVFGYPLRVDPTRYQGPIVEKSNLNYRHDGRVLQGPVPEDELRDGQVYQRWIDTTDESGCFEDLRVSVIGRVIPIAYRKRRPVMFVANTLDAEIVEPLQIFSERERDLLLTFAAKMGVDLGEMDVLRDNDDGRIYVVDVNNTPVSPPKGLPWRDKRRAMACMCKAFESEVETRLADVV